MHFTSVFAATTLASLALAKSWSVSVSNSSGSLVFVPDSLQAATGDTVTFSFWPKNHSVAQAAFNSPCQPLDGGFWSGYIPDSSSTSAASTTFTWTVKNASAPVWYYCSQGSHCQLGMVGVINPPQSGNRTLAAFKSAAKNASSNATPKSVAGTGGAFNMSSSNSSSMSSASASATASKTASSASSTTGTASSTASAPAGQSAAASHLTGSAAFAGLTGLLSYLLL